MKTLKSLIIGAACLLAVLTVGTFESKAQCPGTYTVYYYITNTATGTVWFTVPAGKTGIVATDTSSFSPAQNTVIKITRKDGLSACATNTVGSATVAGAQWKVTIYNRTSPPSTNGTYSATVTFLP